VHQDIQAPPASFQFPHLFGYRCRIGQINGDVEALQRPSGDFEATVERAR